MGLARIPATRRQIDVARAPSLRLDPVAVHTEDGATWDGLVHAPRGGPRARRALGVIVVHGSVGNYISGLPRRVAHELGQAGFTVVSVNTRMANYGVFFGGGLFHQTPLDLDAWVALLRRMGHSRIVLLGYSLGASIVTYYQAERQAAEIVGLCTLAHPLSLPASLQRRWARFGADPDYDTVTRRAQAMLGEDPGDEGPDEVFIVERAAGPTTNPEHAEVWTYRTWWFSRGPEATAAMSCEQMQRVRVPVAFFQAGDDAIVPRTDGEELAAIARRVGISDIRHEVIADANHAFSGREDAVVRRCVEWLDEMTG
jgi:dienelactone hydrolase